MIDLPSINKSDQASKTHLESRSLSEIQIIFGSFLDVPTKLFLSIQLLVMFFHIKATGVLQPSESKWCQPRSCQSEPVTGVCQKKSFTVSSRDPFRYFRFFCPFLASPKNSAQAPGTVKTCAKTRKSYGIRPTRRRGEVLVKSCGHGTHTPPPPDKNEWKWLHFCTVKEFTTKLFLEEAGVFSCWIFLGV